MENKNNKTIQIEAGEEIVSIVNKLKQCEKDEITLMVPSDALLLQSVVNLKILKKKASELRKNISIITADKNNKDNKINENNESSESEQKPSAKSEAVDNASSFINGMVVDSEQAGKKKVKIFDIVKKTDKVKDNENDDRKEEVVAKDKDDVESDLNTTNHEIKKREIARNPLQSSAERLRRGGKAEENKLNEEQSGEQNNIKINESEAIDAPKLRENAGTKKTKKRIALLPSISSKVFAAFIFICFAITALITFFVFQKVNVIIALEAQKTDYNFEFVTDESISEIDTAYNKIPVERIEVVNEKTESYSTTGKKRMTEKAKGEITVYNEYSSSPQKIVINTRFLSKDGKLFRIAKSITIPGFSRVEGKDVPGGVTATVYADVPGEEYNIGASSFTLPGLQGHPKYSSIYARSTQAMSRGIDKDVLYFSESDYITAKDKLVKIAEEESEQDFLSKISDQVILLENTKEKGDVEVKTNTKVGDITNDFEMTVSMKTSALFINKDNLDNLISAKISSELGKNMELVEGSRNYEIKEIIKDENGNITIPVYATQDLIAKIDVNKIKEEIAGKDESELNNYFNNMREIRSATIEFWPDWVKSAPSSYDKINIKFEE